MLHSSKSRVKPSKHRPTNTAVRRHYAFDAIGTRWRVDINQPLTAEASTALLRAIKQRIDTFDRIYSRFRADSLVTKVSKKAGTYILPDDARAMFDLYRQLYEVTKGAVTPLIGSVLADAGYDATYSLVPKAMHPAPSWEEAMQYNAPILTTKLPVLLDFGAAGKGYLVDIIGDIIARASVDSYCIDAGGDILCRSISGTAQSIGLEHPKDPSLAIGVARITNQSLCGSAGNRRVWADYHHIINPATGQSPKHIAAVWVAADSALLADGLTTALFFVEPQVLQARHTFDYAIVYANLSLKKSKNFPAEFFTQQEAVHA